MMKKISQRIASAVIGLTVLVLTGCASSGMTKTSSSGDGETAFAAPAVRVDRLVTKTSQLEGTVYELDAVQIGWREPDGKWVMYFDPAQKKEVPAITRFHRETRTDPIGKTVTVTLVGGVLPAIIQGEYAKEIAKLAQCREGAICDSNVTVNDINAIATGGVGVGGGGGSSFSASQAGAASNSTADVNVNNTGGAGDCKTCGVKPKPVVAK
jgi:hypothetical protein